MSKIIEIWRKETIVGLPVRFIVGQAPSIITNGVLTAIEGPAVSSIVFASEVKDVYRGVCYIINFVESKTKRLIPAVDVADIAYEKSKKKEGVDVPDLEP